MQGGAGARHRIAQRRRDTDQAQPLHGQAQALGHALGGAAGGGSQCHPRQGLVSLHRLCGEEHQQPRDGGGLAGTGAAGHQHQRMAQGDGRGAGLMIDPVAGLREQLTEQRGQGTRIGTGQRMRGDPLQTVRQPTFVFAIATQIEQPVLQHQRCIAGDRVIRAGQLHPRRRLQLRQPRVGCRPVDISLDQALRLGRIQTGVPVRNRQRRQCGPDQHRVGRVRTQPAQALRQGMVERAQYVATVQRGEQAHASPRARAAMRAWACSPPANRASRASTRAGSKRCAYRPGLSSRPVSRPRQNR